MLLLSTVYLPYQTGFLPYHFVFCKGDKEGNVFCSRQHVLYLKAGKLCKSGTAPTPLILFLLFCLILPLKKPRCKTAVCRFPKSCGKEDYQLKILRFPFPY